YTSGLPIQVKLRAVTNTLGACLPVEKIITLHTERKPIADAGDDILSICEDWVQLHAVKPLYNATGIWTTTQPGVIFEDATLQDTKITNLPSAPSEAVVTWTVTNANGTCVSNASSVTLKRIALPHAIDFTAVECETSASKTEIQLTDYENNVTSIPAAERTIIWYKNSAPPSGILVEDPTQTLVVNDNQVFIARIKNLNSPCTQDASVTIKVRSLPKVKDAVIELCEDVATSSIVSYVDLSSDEYST